VEKYLKILLGTEALYSLSLGSFSYRRANKKVDKNAKEQKR
jgi:hypothetical protein